MLRRSREPPSNALAAVGNQLSYSAIPASAGCHGLHTRKLLYNAHDLVAGEATQRAARSRNLVIKADAIAVVCLRPGLLPGAVSASAHERPALQAGGPPRRLLHCLRLQRLWRLGGTHVRQWDGPQLCPLDLAPQNGPKAHSLCRQAS